MDFTPPTPNLPPPSIRDTKDPHLPDPATSGARRGSHGGVVKKAPLPGGLAATIGKPDAHGNERLTIHQPNGRTKQYELDFGKPGDTGKHPGVTTIHPEAHGRMVIHDGGNTVTVGKPGPDGVSQVTVHGHDGAAHRFHLVPPETDLKKFDAAHVAAVGQAMSGGGHSPTHGFGGPGPEISPSGARSLDDAGVTSAQPVGAGATSGATPQFDRPQAPAGAAAPVSATQDGQGGGAMGPMSPGGGRGKGGDSEGKSNKWGMAGNLFDDLTTQRSERLQNFLEGKPPKRDGGQQ
jgi:hypothetical protein